MNRLLLYKWSVALLLILNLATLLYVLRLSPNRDIQLAENGPIILLKELNLSDENFSKVQELGRLHNQKILELNKLEQDLIYQALIEHENFREHENQIAIIEKQKIEVTRKHFRDIENLLDPNQKEAFISIKMDLIKALFRSKRPPIRHPRPL